MRKRTLVLLLVIASCCVSGAQSTTAHSIASLNFDAGAAGDCLVEVRATRANTDGPIMQVLMISCNGKNVLSYPTQDSLIDLFLNYPHDDRIYARWEGGSHVRFTVFRVSGNSSTGALVFDKQLEGTPDVLNTPDVLLVHTGKRWPEGQTNSLPTQTDVYHWTGERYSLTASWKWKQEMRYEDRFCILDPKILTCPMTRVPSE
jgi:hypothetical protein